MTTQQHHYCEGAVRLQPGSGFFRPESRPSRDFGVLLACHLGAAAPVRMLDAMAGCGIRGLRCAVEGGIHSLWSNDADPDRLPLLEANLAACPAALERRHSSHTAQHLLAGCLEQRLRFELVDLDAFGCPTALLPLALEAVAIDGVLYLASSDGRSPTGHDRPAAVRRFGAAARAHPASWELALRLQLGAIARAAWALGRGIEPLLSFSEGRTFRTAVRLRRHPAAGEEARLGLLAHCHGCGDQQQQPLLRLGRWADCACPAGGAGSGGSSGSSGPPPLAVSGPLWLGPLQHPPTLSALLELAGEGGESLAPASRRLLERLRADTGVSARCWPVAEIARRLRHGPPPLAWLVAQLRAGGWRAEGSGVMAGQLRSDAPWPLILATARSWNGECGGRAC
ncbi:MAG: N2,N2-dimethylguanosine tRNA methyltransferase [Cyanobium sp.]